VSTEGLQWRHVSVRHHVLMQHNLQIQDRPVRSRGAQRVPASIAELSLGPPQGSLGVIMEEGSEDCAGSEADEGQSAPHASAAKGAANGKKR
jgi:hypothetical protein